MEGGLRNKVVGAVGLVHLLRVYRDLGLRV